MFCSASGLLRVRVLALIGLSLSLSLALGGVHVASAQLPSYLLGDPVTLRTTVTNMGDTNVASSSFTIRVVSPGGQVFDAGSVEGGTVKPNEDIVIETLWDSVGAVPGTFNILLDGEIRFANGAKQPVSIVLEDAFTLVDYMTGDRQVYVPGNEFTVLDIIPAQESYFVGGPIVIGALINNTGHIQTSMSLQLTFISPEGARYGYPSPLKAILHTIWVPMRTSTSSPLIRGSLTMLMASLDQGAKPLYLHPNRDVLGHRVSLRPFTVSNSFLF